MPSPRRPLVIASTRALWALLVTIAWTAPAHAQAPPPPTPWWERITFFGDVRGRYEGFFRADVAARHRERFRLRFGLVTPVREDLTFTLRFASGDPLDPTSSNQSFTEFFSRKPISIDQVQLTYAPKRLPALRLGGGKFVYPVRRTQLLWDDDLNLEGTYEQVTIQRTRGSVRLVAVQSPLNEVSRGDDAFMFAFQGFGSVAVGSHTVDGSVAAYRFTQADLVARAVAAGQIHSQNTNRLRRDTTGAVVGFESGYHLLDLITQATIATPRKAYPVTVLFEWVRNLQASRSDADSGVLLQATYGRAATPRTVAIGAAFARIEQDAVLAAVAFSDMPATNTWMHSLTATLLLSGLVNLDVIAIRTRPLDRVEPWLTRLQVDARVRF